MDSEVQVHFEMLKPVTLGTFYSVWQEKNVFVAHIIDFIPANKLATLEVAKSVQQMIP